MDLDFGRLTDPRYTGENRCWPCTVLNSVLLALAVAVLAVASLPVAVVAGLLGAGSILVRGYWIPYTPRFGPAVGVYLPWFDHDEVPDDPEPGTLSDSDAEVDGDEVLAALLDADVLEADGERLTMDPAFRERWRDAIRELRALDLDALSDEALEASEAAAVDTVRDGGRHYVVLSDGSDDPANESWLRRPSALAQVGAVRALADAGVDERRQALAAETLAMFLERCPACDGETAERAAGGCCGPPVTGPDGTPKMAIVCTECAVHLHVFD